jgi:hypothetical protein
MEPNLCPVRTSLKYLDTAFGVRSKDSNRLFAPIKQGQNDKLKAWNKGNDNRKYYPTSKILQIKFLSKRQN